MLGSEPANELEDGDEDGQRALDIDDQVQRADVGCRVEGTVEGGFPEDKEKSIELKGDGRHEEEVGQLRPVVHAMLEVEQGEGECEVEGSFEVGEGGDGGVGGAEEDAVEDDDGQLEDEDVVAHGRL